MLRAAARMFSAFERAPLREAFPDNSLFFLIDVPLLWLGRTIMFRLAGRKRMAQLGQLAGMPVSGSGWQGNSTVLLVWAGLIVILVWATRVFGL